LGSQRQSGSSFLNFYLEYRARASQKSTGKVVPAGPNLAHLESGMVQMGKRTHAEYNDFSQKKIAK